jgi:glyceraldehyde 3-phosphate dehydrogenase
MAKKIAINGFGRIGRLTLRNLLNDSSVEVVAINDLTDTKTLAHLFKFDSAQGKFSGTVKALEDGLEINGKKIPTFAIKNPAELPWASLGVDTVLECTGVFTKREQMEQHLQAGAKRVILSAPPKGGGVPTIVRGINDSNIPASETVLSNASCTTNCLAPLVQVLESNWGIVSGAMNTIHAYTADQRLQDAPHSDLRRARAAGVNIVPTSTGAAKALDLVIPSIKGKIMATSMRVPVVTGSLVDLVVVLDKPADVESINAAFKAASEGQFKGILEYCEDPIVSSDIVGNPHSCIFDAALTSVNGNTVRVTGWYDNEAGYSARLAEMAIQL